MEHFGDSSSVSSRESSTPGQYPPIGNSLLSSTESLRHLGDLYEHVMDWCKRRGTTNVLLAIVLITDFDYKKATHIIEQLLNFLEQYKTTIQS